MAESSILFVHGSFFSSWTWLPIIERLTANGLECHAVDLPFTSLADDVAVVQDAIARLATRGPVTAVCHSYTGITLSAAGHGASHLVFVAARMPALGESQTELNKDWGNPAFRSCFAIDPDGTMNGYRTIVSNQATAGYLLFGNFSDCLIGMWGGLDLTVDPYTASTTGTVRVVALQSVDVAVRHAVSFALGTPAP